METVSAVVYRCGPGQPDCAVGVSAVVLSNIASRRVAELADALVMAAQKYSDEELLDGQTLSVAYVVEDDLALGRFLELEAQELFVLTDEVLAQLVDQGHPLPKALHLLCSERAMSCIADSINRPAGESR